MELSNTTFAMLSSLSLFAGVLSAIAGSSGLLMLPALLLTGMPPHMALGTNKLYTTAGLLTSSLVFIRQRLFNYRLWITAILATIFGSILGAGLALIVPTDVIKLILPVMMLGIAIYFLLPNKLPNQSTAPQSTKPAAVSSGIVGSLIGLYSGFIGAGSASLWTSAAMSIFNIEIVEASALSRVMCLISNTMGLAVFMALRNVDYILGASLVFFGCIGAYFGSKLALRFGSKLIRPTIILISGGMALKLMFDFWF